MGEVTALRPSVAHPIPDEALNSHIGILGKVGSGKSYTAKGLAERLLHLHRQVVIIDPTGAWYGLRTGFEIPIFGGPHGDVEIGDLAGEPVASVIVEQRASAIIDLSLMSANGQKRFMRDFAHRLRMKPPGALYLFLDEADEFLPQEKVKGAGSGTDLNLFGDLKWMVRRGRLNGFRVTMITQRPAEIAKAVLTQIETLVAHRLTAPQDRKAVEEWVKGHADPEAHKEVLSSLASLEKGVAWVWAPDLDILVKAKMPAIETFDSGRTPEPGEIEVKMPALADLNLTAIKDKLVAVEQEAKANDPKALKAEVARLTRELAAASKGSAPAWPDQRETVAELVTELGESAAALDRLTANAKELQRRQEAALAALGGQNIAIPDVTPPRPRPVARQQMTQAVAEYSPIGRGPPASREPRQSEASDALTASQRRVLNALAWWQAFGISAPTNEQVGFVAGYSPGSGNFNNLKGQLRAQGLLDYPSPGKVTLTVEGVMAADEPQMEVSCEAFRQAVRAKLSASQLRLFDPILMAYPNDMATTEVADAAGYSAGSGNFNNLRGQLRTIGVIDYPSPGYVRAADWLFP